MKNTILTFAVIAFSVIFSHAEDKWTPSPLCPYPSENLTRFPYQGDCTKFWECFEGSRYPMDCPQGQEYNERNQTCDVPSIAQCDKYETITYPTFPHSAITEVTSSGWTPNQLCPYPSESLTFYPCAENCSQYWECFRGDRYLMTCPEGLYWNVKYDYCDYLENVDCSQNNVTATPPPATSPITTTSTSATGAWTPDPLCPYPSEDITYYVYPYNCSQYWECYQGNKYLMTCPTDLYWNDAANVCDFKDNVNCDRTPATTKPTTTTTPSNSTATPGPTNTTTTALPTTTPTGSLCANQSDGTFLPDPTDCSKFYECDGGKALSQSCPGNLLWNKDKSVCDFAENVTC